MSAPEVWLRGLVEAVPPLLQPVAHGLIQCREEMAAILADLTSEQIWTAPGGAAPIGFHLRHAAGSLDRLFTYARGEPLSAAQRAELAAEAHPDLAPNAGARLTASFGETVDRAQLPSTVLGLLFHAAEHTQRHAGQAATTAKFLRGSSGSSGSSGS